MSMNGDLPGLPKRCVGTIGSYQYSTLRSPADAAETQLRLLDLDAQRLALRVRLNTLIAE